MATNVSKTHLFRALNKRHFGSAAPSYSGNYSNDVKVTTLPNKAIVASADSLLPLSRVSVVIRAGSRYDPPGAPGLNHVLRASAGLSTTGASTFGIIRNIQQIGGSITCTSNRDTITYTLEATCDNIQKGLKYLKDVVVSQAFKPWELEDNVPRIKYELATIPPQARLVDLLHKAAYRNGLGNSLYVKEFNIGKIGTETLQHYVSSLFSSSRTAVVGIGISHDTISSFASELELPVISGPEVPGTYYGGSVVEEGPTKLVYAGVVGQAAGLKGKNLLTYAVLRHALGGWSNIKWSKGNSPLAKAITSGPDPVAVSAFNAVHSDSGLFGVIIAAPSSQAKSVLTAAVQEVQNAVLQVDGVERAKNQLKSEIYEASQNGEELAADVAGQLLLGKAYKNPECFAEAIDKIQAKDVNEAKSKTFGGNKTLAAYGNLTDIPYLDELN